MRLTLAAVALIAASGAALAQGTTPSTTTTPGATTPSTTTPSVTMPSATVPGPAGSQTPGASVNTTPATSSPSPSAVQTNNTSRRTAAAPVPGRNSFTMNQAARRITSAGFTQVTGLKKDGHGIWRGQAQKDGAPVAVSLDYQGNVTGK